MRHAIDVAPLGELADPRVVVRLAVAAEREEFGEALHVVHVEVADDDAAEVRERGSGVEDAFEGARPAIEEDGIAFVFEEDAGCGPWWGESAGGRAAEEDSHFVSSVARGAWAVRIGI